MELTHQINDGICIVGLDGRFDAFQAPVLSTFYDENISAEKPNIILNMKGVVFIDSMGLSTIVKGMKRCREHGGDLVLCELQQAVQVIFELTRMNQAITIVASLDDAKQQFKK